MSEPLEIGLTTDAEDHPIVNTANGTAKSLTELLTLAPDLRHPAHLGTYCDALNHFQHGTQFRVIHDPNAFRTRYERKLASENPEQPFQDGVARVGDFGVCDLSIIEVPELVGETVVFFVEDDFLGIPYRVTGPAPSETGDVQYEPLPMNAES
jgi:hypothetical protein